MSTSVRDIRPVDHLVLPVTNLEIARERLTSLGFTVAPDAKHPFGTENACVFFKDDTYLEPLAIDHRETCEKAALKGNVFVERDQAFRFRKGHEGFSAVVFGSKDSDGDHKQFKKHGMSAGKMLKFMRDVDDGNGNISQAGFKLAFAGDLRSPDSFFVTCERINPPVVDKKKLQKHKNGAVSIKEVVLSEAVPSDFQYILQEVINQREVNSHSFGMDIKSANANIAVYTGEGLKAWFGMSKGCHSRGLRLRAFVIGVRDLEKTEAFLKKSKIKAKTIAGRLVVDHAAGQGCVIAFENHK
ncbi:MAG: lactoylglutathione lyase [Hyphomicrobiales bacterium]|nr:VOC family protein [Hyphomicrobiales bacterium]PCH50591.1 MAG: lactoylglutathione lyase [Hyphomicrobiales bacterium]